MKVDKNIVLGLGLIALAVIIYRRNNKAGIGTVGVNTPVTKMSNACGACANG